MGTLEKMMCQKGIPFEIVCDEDEIFHKKKIEFFPTLEVDGKLLDYGEALEWVNRYDGESVHD
jgi:hypothetical protein